MSVFTAARAFWNDLLCLRSCHAVHFGVARSPGVRIPPDCGVLRLFLGNLLKDQCDSGGLYLEQVLGQV
jgi:hypothetical protein